MRKTVSHESAEPVKDEPTSILSLEVQSFKRIRAARFRMQPQGLTILAGNNGQGKTSAIDALECLLGGGRAIPQKPVHDDDPEARIVAELPGYTVRRTIQPDRRTALQVTRSNGTPVDRPQEFLDALVGPIAFDPLAFSRMAPKEQAETLRQLVGLDLSDLDAAKRVAYDQRTLIGRERDRLKGHADSLPYYEHAPAEPVDADELGTAVQQAFRHNRHIEEQVAEVERLRAEYVRNADRLAELQAEIAKLTAIKSKLIADAKAAKAQIEQAGEPIDIDPMLQAIADAEAVNSQVRANADQLRAYAEAGAKAREYNGLTDEMADLDERRRARLAAVEFPVDGLAFTDTGDVTYLGLPFEQASGAEQLRLSTAIAMAMNPTLKVAFVRDGSLLDAESLGLIDEQVRQAGGQVLLERVGTGDEAHVIIEDGAVVAER